MLENIVIKTYSCNGFSDIILSELIDEHFLFFFSVLVIITVAIIHINKSYLRSLIIKSIKGCPHRSVRIAFVDHPCP